MSNDKKVTRHRPAQTRMDIGMEVMHQLMVKGEPLTAEQIVRYCAATEDDPIESVRERRKHLIKMVDLLSRCSLPVPIDIMVMVCRCSRAHIAAYNKKVMEHLCDKAYRAANFEALCEWGDELEVPPGPYWRCEEKH